MVYFTHFTAQTLELDCYWDVLSYRLEICDMIKGNESLVENFNFNFFTPLSHSFKMLHFDENPLQLDIWFQSYEGFVNAKNNIKQRNLNTVHANISKTIWPTSDSFLLIVSHLHFTCNHF